MLTRHARTTEGFTLIETLVGIAILALVSLSLYALFDFTLKVLWENKARAGAQVLANQIIETGHNLPYDDVGTVGGIPNGTIEPTTVVTNNGIEFTVNTAVIYIDDPFDGTLGGVPDDLLPADYKRIRVEISWNFRLSSEPVVFLSDIAPNGIESVAGGGTLRITVLDASGLPVPQADVHIENNALVPAVNVDLQTNDNGQIILPGALESVEAYEVTATKSGYSVDQTYSVDPVNLPTPSKPHITVLEGQVTDASFAIDVLSTVNVFAFTENTHTPAWWDENYTVRRRLTVTNNSSADLLPAGYSVQFDFDHYDQVQQGDSLANGDDVRMLYWNGAAWQEINRVAESAWNNSSDTTEVWFATQSDIAASGFDDNYFLYYSNPSATSPLNDPRLVYQFYDDFEDETYTYDNWSTSTDTWVVQAGEYHQTSTGVETYAVAGPSMGNVWLEADMRSQTITNDIGLIGRFGGSFGSENYYLGRPADTPVSVASMDDQDYSLGSRSFVQATDNALAFFTINSTDSTYRMYTSTDNGVTWGEAWALPVASGQYSHSAWLDTTDDSIYYVFTQYDSVDDEYELRLIVFSYNSGTQVWTPGAAKTIIANSYDERSYRPNVLTHSGEVFVTYARFDSSGFHEIGLRTSTDSGDTWSPEIFLTDWNQYYSNQDERRAVEGQLVVYNNEVTAILNGARMFGWRRFNGVAWSAYEELVASTFHNQALSSVVHGTNPNQELHVFYRHAGDSGRPHQYHYDGSWSDNLVSSQTTNYAYAAAYADNKLAFLFGSPDDNSAQMYISGQEAGSWVPSEPVYPTNTPINEITAIANDQVDGHIHMVFNAGANGSRNIYAHAIGLFHTPGHALPRTSISSGGTRTSETLSSASFTTTQSYSVRQIYYSNLVAHWTDNVLVFADHDSSHVSGQLSLFANNTDAYFDNVLARMYVRPEPSVSGNLEEDLELSQPLPSFPFNFRGSKLIGFDAAAEPVYKYNATSTTDGSGQVSLTNMEWDAYTVNIDDVATTYDLSGIDPPDPISLLPNTIQQVNMYLVGDAAHTLRVTVLDVDGDPIEDANVRVYNTGLSYDENDDTPSYGQSFFTPLSIATYNVDVTKTGFNAHVGTAAVNNDTVEVVTLTTGGTPPPPPSPPAAPTITGFTNVTETSMTITWQDNADNEDGYRVYRNTVNTKPGTPVVTLPANTTSYPNLSLTCETTYYYWVEAYNSQGDADDTSSQATLACPTPPAAPTITGFTSISETGFTVQWTDNATNEDGYRIYIDTVNTKPGVYTDDIPADSTSYSFPGLSCGTTYYVWVEAYNSQGNADDTSNQDTSICAPTLVFSDTFTESSNTTLTSHTPDIGSGWTHLIEIAISGTSRLRAHGNSDQLRRQSCRSSEGALYQTNDVIGQADYEVRITQINGDNSDDYNFLAARIQDANNMYAVRWNESSTRLYAVVGGVWSTIAGPIGGVSDGSEVTLKVAGTTISVLQNSATILSVTDSSHSTAGRAGVGMGALVNSSDDCSSQQLDNFEVWETN